MAAPPHAAPAAAQAPPAAEAQKFSLGAAAFGGQPDDSCAHPDEQAPLAWQRMLVQLADPPALRGLFTSCRGGRDLVLAHAPQVALTLPLLLDQPYEQWIAQHYQLKSALITRGRLPTRLHIDGWDGRREPQVQGTPLPMQLLAVLLQPTTAAGISEAVIQSKCPQHPQPSAVTQVLAALPSLTRLELSSAQPITLPHPTHLPLLRELSVECSVQAISSNLALYIPQLTSLQLEGTSNVPAGIPCALLFTAAAPAQHLTTFIARNTSLTDELLELLLDHAPALACLSVSRIQLLDTQYVSRVWGVTDLTVRGTDQAAMVRVPACKAGKLTWHMRDPDGDVLELVCESVQVGCTKS